jgi:predicted small secreted protein
MFRKILLLPLVLMYAISLSACNTMEGAGKDIKSGGEKIENAADKAKN